MPDYDWTTIRKKLRPDRWYLLDTDAPYTTAEAIRQGAIRKMQGVEVRTRNNRFDTRGKRWCDILLREES